MPVRVDFDVIASLIRFGARVLDVGCGDGRLLELLTVWRAVDGSGVVELSQQGVDQCLAKGLSASLCTWAGGCLYPQFRLLACMCFAAFQRAHACYQRTALQLA